MLVQIFANMDSTTQASRCMSTLMVQDSLPFLTLNKPSCTCVDRDVLLRSEHYISLLQQSSVFATSFVLGVSGWEQSFNLTPLDNHQVSSLGPISIIPHFPILSSLGARHGAQLQSEGCQRADSLSLPSPLRASPAQLWLAAAALMTVKSFVTDTVVATHSGKQTHSGQCRYWSAVYYTGGPKAESPLSQGPWPAFVKIFYTPCVRVWAHHSKFLETYINQGKYNPNNPIIHVLCAHVLKESNNKPNINKPEVTLRYRRLDGLSGGRVIVYVFS